MNIKQANEQIKNAKIHAGYSSIRAAQYCLSAMRILRQCRSVQRQALMQQARELVKHHTAMVLQTIAHPPTRSQAGQIAREADCIAQEEVK